MATPLDGSKSAAGSSWASCGAPSSRQWDSTTFNLETPLRTSSTAPAQAVPAAAAADAVPAADGGCDSRAVPPRAPTAGADWWRHAVVYQIYPRSFADSDGDGIGDLRGIISRIPYLAALGIDAVWLSPFYPSALADGGYDVDDYRGVDPRLGTLADFDRTRRRAAQRPGSRSSSTSCPITARTGIRGSSRRWQPAGARRPGTGTSSAMAAVPTARSRHRTGTRCSAAHPGRVSRTASGTCTRSLRSNPT